MGMIFVNRDRQSLGQFTDQETSNALEKGDLLPTDLGWMEGMEAWQPLSSFTNLPPPGAIPAPAGVPEKFRNLTPNRLKPDRICFGECFSKGWDAFKKNWGVCVVATLIFIGISLIVQAPMQFAQILMEKFVGPKGSGDMMMAAAAGGVFVFFWALATAVSTLLTGGFMYFFITTLRTKANLNDLFAGFRRSAWLQILLAGSVWVAAVFVLILVCIVPAAYLTHTTKSQVPIFVAAGVLILPLIYLSVGIGYVFPLIVDRGLGFWSAIKTALKTVHCQWFSALGLLILVGLVAASGVLLCCVGMLATMPLAYLIWCQGYRQMFGDPDSAAVD